jgi:hypothetical protein
LVEGEFTQRGYQPDIFVGDAEVQGAALVTDRAIAYANVVDISRNLEAESAAMT